MTRTGLKAPKRKLTTTKAKRNYLKVRRDSKKADNLLCSFVSNTNFNSHIKQ